MCNALWRLCINHLLNTVSLWLWKNPRYIKATAVFKHLLQVRTFPSAVWRSHWLTPWNRVLLHVYRIAVFQSMPFLLWNIPCTQEKKEIIILYITSLRERSSVVGWGTMIQFWRSQVWFPKRSLDWPHSSSSIISLGLAQPLTEMSIRNLPGVKGRPMSKTDNLAVIFEPDV
jgi:hypothetical protein